MNFYLNYLIVLTPWIIKTTFISQQKDALYCLLLNHLQTTDQFFLPVINWLSINDKIVISSTSQEHIKQWYHMFYIILEKPEYLSIFYLANLRKMVRDTCQKYQMTKSSTTARKGGQGNSLENLCEDHLISLYKISKPKK